MPSRYPQNSLPVAGTEIFFTDSRTGNPIDVIPFGRTPTVNARAKTFEVNIPTSTSNIIDNANGTVTITQADGSVQDSIRPLNELNPLVGNLDTTTDRIALYDASSGLHTWTTASVINAPEVFRSNIPLTGLAPSPYKVGIDYSTGTQYYVNTAGNWTAFPPSTTVFVTDLPNGKVNINASLGGSQDSIRPIDELSAIVTPSLTDKFPVLQGTNHQSITLAQIRETLTKKFRIVQNLSAGSNTINHNLALASPFATIVEVRNNLTGSTIEHRVTSETTNTVTINVTVPTTNSRITIIG
jgi:hypothetical protein